MDHFINQVFQRENLVIKLGYVGSGGLAEIGRRDGGA